MRRVLHSTARLASPGMVKGRHRKQAIETTDRVFWGVREHAIKSSATTEEQFS